MENSKKQYVQPTLWILESDLEYGLMDGFASGTRENDYTQNNPNESDGPAINKTPIDQDPDGPTPAKEFNFDDGFFDQYNVWN